MDFYKIFFIPGFFQNKKTFSFLIKHLKSHGFDVENIQLPLTFKNISISENILEEKIEKFSKDTLENSAYNELILIGFGLGGVLIKKVLNGKKFENLFVKVILISTPSKRPKIIRKFSILTRIFSLIFKPLKVLLNKEYLATEISEDIATGVIRGTESHKKIFKPFISEPNDGFLQSNDAFIKGENIEILDLPFGRYELLKRTGTAEYIVDFIKSGRFKFD